MAKTDEIQTPKRLSATRDVGAHMDYLSQTTNVGETKASCMWLIKILAGLSTILHHLTQPLWLTYHYPIT